MMHRFDRMEIEEIVREITCGVRNAYPETVMGKVMEENRNMAREWKNMKMEIEYFQISIDDRFHQMYPVVSLVVLYISLSLSQSQSPLSAVAVCIPAKNRIQHVKRN